MTSAEYQAQFGKATGSSTGKKGKKPPGDVLTAEQFRRDHVDQQEHDIQVQVIDWFDREPRYRDFLLYAIPNGGHRHISVAKSLKAEGVRRGTPDLCLAVVTQRYPGLYLEMKRHDGRASSSQKHIMQLLRQQGYRVEVPRSLEEAKAIITDYLREHS